MYNYLENARDPEDELDHTHAGGEQDLLVSQQMGKLVNESTGHGFKHSKLHTASKTQLALICLGSLGGMLKHQLCLLCDGSSFKSAPTNEQSYENEREQNPFKSHLHFESKMKVGYLDQMPS